MKIKVLSEEEVNKSKNIKLKSVKVERDYQLNRVLEVKFSDYNVSVIYGENGCGKTTILRLINAFLSQNDSVFSQEKVLSMSIAFCTECRENVVSVYKKERRIKIKDEKNETIEQITWYYDWEEYRNSPLFGLSSILFGVNRGIVNSLQQISEDDIYDTLFRTKYREKFDGIKENLDSYQFMISGGYNFTKDTDLSSVLTYSHNKHKYNSSSLKYTAYDDAKYNSKVIDFQMRLGSKFSSNESYIKPFIGFGITNVTENEIEKLGLDKAKGTSANATIGAYGQLALSSSVNLFGNLEYEHRFSNKSYHRDRNFKNISGKMEALDYDGIFNAEVGVKFKLSRFDVTTSYELRDIHNHLFKVGFGVKF